MSHCHINSGTICNSVGTFWNSILALPQPPEWITWLTVGITLYLVISMTVFGCPYCFTPNLAWGPALVIAGITLALHRLGLLPDRFYDECSNCGDQMLDWEIRYSGSEFDEEKKFCSRDCCETWKEERGVN